MTFFKRRILCKNDLYSPIADSYILQIQRCETPVEQLPLTPTIPSQISLNNPSLPLQSISASLFATKSPQSGTIHVLFSLFSIL